MYSPLALTLEYVLDQGSVDIRHVSGVHVISGSNVTHQALFWLDTSNGLLLPTAGRWQVRAQAHTQFNVLLYILGWEESGSYTMQSVTIHSGLGRDHVKPAWL